MKTRLMIVLGILGVGLTVLASVGFQAGNIGITIGAHSEGEPQKIHDVFPGSPADLAGVQANWFVIAIDGTNVVSATSTRCMSLLHGVVGTSVTLELADPQRQQTNRFIMKRDDVPLPDDMFRGFFETNAASPLRQMRQNHFLIAH